MENKCLVCGAIIPEGRQVCPTCGKGGKHEISKKLTDEEIVKALKNASTGYGAGIVGNLWDLTLDLINRQKAEIERLTESYDRAWTKVEEEHNAFEYQRKCTEALQKQVDELTKQREVGREKLKNEIANKIFMSASHGAIQCGKMSVAIAEIEAEKYVEFAWEMVQQAVKDTAKEILQGIMNIIKKSDGFLAQEVVRIMAKQKNVEVE